MIQFRMLDQRGESQKPCPARSFQKAGQGLQSLQEMRQNLP